MNSQSDVWYLCTLCVLNLIKSGGSAVPWICPCRPSHKSIKIKWRLLHHHRSKQAFYGTAMPGAVAPRERRSSQLLSRGEKAHLVIGLQKSGTNPCIHGFVPDFCSPMKSCTGPRWNVIFTTILANAIFNEGDSIMALVHSYKQKSCLKAWSTPHFFSW